MRRNNILAADSYKFSHFNLFVPDADGYYGYIESRGCNKHWSKTLFFGIQAFIKEYLLNPITIEDVEEAEEFCKAHGVPFNKDGFMKIVTRHNGYFPVKIKAIPEGTIVPQRIPLVTIESTDPELFWVGGFIETMILRGIWYPTTVATNSWYWRQVVKGYREKTGGIEGLDFAIHDFGQRGVSSSESAALGGMAHLATGAKGSDTIEGILAAKRYYNEPMAAYSIPASEHSVVTSWGKEREVDAFKNMIDKYAGEGKIFACISDSFNIYNAVEHLWGEILKEDIVNSRGILVVRPDSGQPDVVVRKCIEMLDNKFGHTINEKGYKVLNHVRVIQGDGIDEVSITNILGALEVYGYSADNVAFGSGGRLLQILDRDTLKFACKMSAVRVSGKWKEVFKDPIDDPGKTSKKGRVTTYLENGEYIAGILNESWADTKIEALQLVYENGKLYNETTFAEVRERSNH